MMEMEIDDPEHDHLYGKSWFNITAFELKKNESVENSASHGLVHKALSVW